MAARQYLWLPPLKNPICDSVERKCGCQTQRCDRAACAKQDLLPLCDTAGNHGLTCHPGVKAQKASILERTLDRAFRLAGGNPSRQPSTYSLLGGYFTKEDIANLFCGTQSKKDSELRKDLAMKFIDVTLDNKSTLTEIEPM